MSEENQVVAEQPVEAVVDYKALYEKTKADLDTVAAKKDELYKETKAAKAAREQAIAEAKRIEHEKAVKDGEFENLWKSERQLREEREQQFLELKNGIRKEKLQIAAMRISQDLADGDNAELLSDFVVRNLDKMADESGALSADVLEAVKKEFMNNGKYKALLRGSKASGGNAQGNSNTKAESGIKEITMAEYNKLDGVRKLEFSKLSQAGKARII